MLKNIWQAESPVLLLLFIQVEFTHLADFPKRLGFTFNHLWLY